MNAEAQAKFARLIGQESIPSWLREEIARKADEILAKLESEGEYVIHGPNGETVTIHGERVAA